MIKIGTDIVLNSRFSEYRESLFEHLFTERKEAENRVNKSEYYGSRFASKEALVKALGTGFMGITPLDIEIREDSMGAPYILLRGKRKEAIHLSISHDGDYSLAFVVIENE
mgnify:FL=1